MTVSVFQPSAASFILSGRMLTRHDFGQRFGRRAVIGMVHLAPLPGAPLYGGSLDEVIARALADAETLAAGGGASIAVHEFWDRTFRKHRVAADTIAAMTRVAA